MNIGFIGLGEIGTEMVKRLCGADFPVTVYPRGTGLADARQAGATECANYAALAAESDALIVIVFNDDQLRDILFGQGALAAMRPGSVLAVHVTGSPALRGEIQQRAPQGVDVLDATFSGSVSAVRKGALTLMVGGAVDALERLRPMFSAYASNIFHVGEPGDAQVLKLLNNLVLAANMMNAAELLKAGESYGLDPKTVASVLQTCSGASTAMGIFAQRDVAEGMDAARRYMVKDVQEAMLAARDAGLDLGSFDQTVRYWRDN
jgi:3-hydroxyisobutyrate dehydrogenase-like beta-hydroxyacid dehydrogenase